MIIIGIGANLPRTEDELPRKTCGQALESLNNRHIFVQKCSHWYKTAPVPISDSPWYVNAVASLETSLSANDLLSELLDTEARFGRQRSVPNAARTLDLDLLCYGTSVLDQRIEDGNKVNLVLPHPRMHQRAFVLLPLRQLVPDWVHPVSGATIDELISELPPEQDSIIMEDADGLFATEYKINIA